DRGGTLYFSTNFRGFELSPDKVPGAHFEELTPRSLPEDFHRRDSHRLWRITAGEAEAEGAAARPRGGAAEPGSTRGSTGRAGRRRRSTGSPRPLRRDAGAQGGRSLRRWPPG